MATSVGDSSFDRALSEDDLSDIINALQPVAHKYKRIGIQLKQIRSNDIESIEMKSNDPVDRLLEVLSLRLRRTPALTWREVYSALRSKGVDESVMAEDIWKIHGHNVSSHDPSPEDSACQKQEEHIHYKKQDTKKGVNKEKDTRDVGNEKSQKELTKEVEKQKGKCHDQRAKEDSDKEVSSEKLDDKGTLKSESASESEYFSANESGDVSEGISCEHTRISSSKSVSHKKKYAHLNEDKLDEREKRSSTMKEALNEKSTKQKVYYGAKDQSHRSRRDKKHDIQPKKRNRRRHRDSCMSHTARGSSSPSTSEEENQGSKKEKRKRKGHKKKGKGQTKMEEYNFESDDSSPSCDELSGSEIHGMNIFKRFYGRLCCEISNPVETAAQLQMKGLISKAVMKKLIRSPESQQVKTITLVDELDKKIKSKPDCLFNLIDVLLERDNLQKVGKEILTEAGKEYPERILERFPNYPSPSHNVVSSQKVAGRERVKREIITKTATPQLSSYQATTGGTETPSSQEVSLYVPQSGLSPVLAKYKKYLQSCYNARVLAPADKYLPSRESPYINLAMIGRRHYNHEQRDEFTRQTLHGGVDQILKSKTPINIEDLLTSEDSNRPVRFILVEGPPGIGKSTFAWEVCRRWDEIESLRDYHTVVLLKLREKWVLNATSLSDLFRYPSHPDFSNSIAEELVKSQGEKLLFVLDGFDEVSHSFHENSVIKSILCRQLLPECTIILTTRPVAKTTLESICQPRVDKHVEIIGFTEEERVRYITEVFSKEPELQINFLNYMFLVPHIKSMMYIPLNCAIIAQVYYESQSSHHLAIPRTRTQLYKALTHSLLVRHMRTIESNHDYSCMLPKGLDKSYFDHFKSLAKFAFDSYHQKSKKVTFFKEDIPEGLVHFGFMNESTEMYAGKGVEQIFSFLHLSLQEYLAAWHVADSYSIEFQVAYCGLNMGPQDNESDNKEEKTLISQLKQQRSLVKEPAIFLAGITGWGCQSDDDRNHWETFLSHHKQGFSMFLICSLYEAQNPNLPPHYFSTENTREISIGSFNSHEYFKITTPYDCYALSYCLAHSSEQFNLAIRISRDYDISLVETFFKGLNDHCNSTTPRVSKFVLQLTTRSEKNANNCLFWVPQAKCWSDLNEIEFGSEWRVSSDLINDFLKKLVTVKYIALQIPSSEWLPSLKCLSNLQLKAFHIDQRFSIPERMTRDRTQTDSDREYEEVPYSSRNHRWDAATLDVELPSSTTAYDTYHSINVGINSLLKSVEGSNQIKKICLSKISHETMASVRNILLHSPSLTTLELKRTRLGYDGILYICSALRNNTTLRHLVIRNKLQLPPSRNDVILPGKTTCTDLLLELSNIVKDNTLEEMTIEPDATSGDDERMILEFKLCNISSDVAHDVLETMAKNQLLKNVEYCTKWLASPESLKHLRELLISNKSKHYYHLIKEETKLYIELPPTTIIPDICNSVFHLVIQFNIVNVVLSNISHETMADLRNILLHCPSLTTLELKRTRLGYDGILYICSALISNTTLRHLVIHDDLQSPPSRKRRYYHDATLFTTFSSMERVPLPGKTTCTDFLLELNNILKDNTTLEKMKIQSGLFLPLSAGEDREYCQWTGLGPLQQFNVGAVGSGMSPNLRRSFSSSDLIQSQTRFWDRHFPYGSRHKQAVDFKKLFSKRKEEGKQLFSRPSFTAPDTEVLRSFSGLDPRLKECLEISHLHQYVERLRDTCWGMLLECKMSTR